MKLQVARSLAYSVLCAVDSYDKAEGELSYLHGCLAGKVLFGRGERHFMQK